MLSVLWSMKHLKLSVSVLLSKFIQPKAADALVTDY